MIEHSQDTWNQEVDHELSALEGAADQARLFTERALGYFSEMISSSGDTIEYLINETKTEIEAKMLHSILAPEAISRLRTKAINIHKYPLNQSRDFHKFFDMKCWNDAGFALQGTLSEKFALYAIRSLPLKLYRILLDTKKTLYISENERRTRTHIGVIDEAIAAQFIPNHTSTSEKHDVDPSIHFSCNLKAVAALILRMDALNAKPRIVELYSAADSLLSNKINEIVYNASLEQNDFVSLAQIATEGAALDANVSLKNIEIISHATKNTLRMKKVSRNSLRRLRILNEQNKSAGRISDKQTTLESNRNHEKLIANADLDVTIEALVLIGQIMSLRNETRT